MDSGWYFRNRTRNAILGTARVIRQLQVMSSLRSSEVIRILRTAFRESGENRTAVYLENVFKELEKDEQYDPVRNTGWDNKVTQPKAHLGRLVVLPEDPVEVLNRLRKCSKDSKATLMDVREILGIIEDFGQ